MNQFVHEGLSVFCSILLSVSLSHYLSVIFSLILVILPLSLFFSLEGVDLAIMKPIKVQGPNLLVG